MPRRRPSHLRSAGAVPPGAAIHGVAMATSYALDRLARPEISSLAIQRALRGWRDVAVMSPAMLGGAHNDWTEIAGPSCRQELEWAMRALPRRHAAALRAVVERADQDFCAKTLPNLDADPFQGWWWRRRGR